MKPAYTVPLQVGMISLRTANAYVEQFHRHCRPVQGHKFSLGGYARNPYCPDLWRLAAIAIIARPVARHLDDGQTLEIRRLVSSPGCPPNMCSKMLATARRLCKRLGVTRLITYTLASEKGTSLRAAGWQPFVVSHGGNWHRPSRPRRSSGPEEAKIQWHAPL